MSTNIQSNDDGSGFTPEAQIILRHFSGGGPITNAQVDSNFEILRLALNSHSLSGGNAHPAATTSSNGFLSSADKAKIDGISTSANNYILPIAGDNSLGGVKLGYPQAGKNYPVKLSSSQAYVTVPWTDTVYSLPTASASTRGGIKIGYNASDKNYAVELDNTNKAYVNVPWTDTIYSLPTASSGTRGGIKVGYSASGKNYPVELDEQNNAYVNVPWTDTDTVLTQGTVKSYIESAGNITFDPGLPIFNGGLHIETALTIGPDAYNADDGVTMSYGQNGFRVEVGTIGGDSNNDIVLNPKVGAPLVIEADMEKYNPTFPTDDWGKHHFANLKMGFPTSGYRATVLNDQIADSEALAAVNWRNAYYNQSSPRNEISYDYINRHATLADTSNAYNGMAGPVIYCPNMPASLYETYPNFRMQKRYRLRFYAKADATYGSGFYIGIWQKHALHSGEDPNNVTAGESQWGYTAGYGIGESIRDTVYYDFYTQNPDGAEGTGTYDAEILAGNDDSYTWLYSNKGITSEWRAYDFVFDVDPETIYFNPIVLKRFASPLHFKPDIKIEEIEITEERGDGSLYYEYGLNNWGSSGLEIDYRYVLQGGMCHMQFQSIGNHDGLTSGQWARYSGLPFEVWDYGSSGGSPDNLTDGQDNEFWRTMGTWHTWDIASDDYRARTMFVVHGPYGADAVFYSGPYIAQTNAAWWGSVSYPTTAYNLANYDG